MASEGQLAGFSGLSTVVESVAMRWMEYGVGRWNLQELYLDEVEGMEVRWAKTAMILCGGPAGQGADFTERAD